MSIECPLSEDFIEFRAGEYCYVSTSQNDHAGRLKIVTGGEAAKFKKDGKTKRGRNKRQTANRYKEGCKWGGGKKGTLPVIIVFRRQSLIPSLITTWTFYNVDYVQFTNQSKTI